MELASMLSCLKTQPPPSTTSYLSSPASRGDLVENTPRSIAQPSQTIDLTREYTLAFQTSSYGEIRRTFDHDTSFDQTVDSGHLDGIEGAQLLEQVLQPSRECVEETLSTIRPSPLTDLVSIYFEHSEKTSHLCFFLYQRVRGARLAYAPIHDLLDCLPLDFDSDSYSLSDSQCNLACDVFLQFDRLEIPSSLMIHRTSTVKGPSPTILFNGICLVFDCSCCWCGHNSCSNSYPCFGSPLCFALFPSNMTKKGKVNLVQLDEASRSAYVLIRDLDTIDRLVAHLHADVENDKFSIHHALERDMDRYLIQEILKQLQRNRPSFMERLAYLEDNLFLCFAAINRTRSSVLQKIQLHQLPIIPIMH